MNKVKVFFIAAAMVLTTAGVFAGKARFATPDKLWGYNATAGYVPLATGSTPGFSTHLNTTTGTPGTIASGTVSYSLYSLTGATYTAVTVQ